MASSAANCLYQSALATQNPSLSASIIATILTSGRSSPSRSKVNTYQHRIRLGANHAKYHHAQAYLRRYVYTPFLSSSSKYALKSSAIRLVRVVISTRCFLAILSLISAIKSSIWPFVGRICISGSKVGRAYYLLRRLRDYAAAHSHQGCRHVYGLVYASNSSNRSGRLSSALGKRNRAPQNFFTRSHCCTYLAPEVGVW